MAPREIEALVKENTGRMLETLPEGFRPTAVNRVVLDSAFGKGSSGEWGGWAEWTRACCGSRHLIEDFEDPLMDDIEVVGSAVLNKVGGIHVESQLRIADLEDPETHVGPAREE